MGNYHQKKGKGKLPLFCVNIERVINIYALQCGPLDCSLFHKSVMHHVPVVYAPSRSLSTLLPPLVGSKVVDGKYFSYLLYEGHDGLFLHSPDYLALPKHRARLLNNPVSTMP